MMDHGDKNNKVSIENTIIGILFIVFLLASMIFTTINSKESYKKAEKAGGVIEAWNMDYDIDSNLKVNVFAKQEYLNLQGYISKTINQRELNDVIKLNNGYLTSVQPQATDEALVSNVETLANIQDYLESKGIKFIYVRAPYKICVFDSQLPEGVIDYSADNSKRFVELLDQYNINYIDIGLEMHNDGLNQYDYYYKTDHHWTPEGGLYAFSKIDNEIKKELGINEINKYTDIDSYNIEVYKEWHLGSSGQRVGVYYAGADDMHYIKPKEDVIITDVTTQKTDSFFKIMYDESVLCKRDYEQRLTYDNLYGATMGHQLHNDSALNNIKVLVSSDSMGKVVVPYMVLSYEDVYWAGISKEQIDEYKPDIVVLITYQKTETTTNGLEFN